MLHAFGGFFKVVMSDLFPEKPKVAREQQRFMPLMNLADSRNGTYEVLGRAGRAVFESEMGTCSVTARAGVSDVKLVVSAFMPLNGFVLEISNDPIRRADLESFTVRDEDDRVFFIGDYNRSPRAYHHLFILLELSKCCNNVLQAKFSLMLCYCCPFVWR